MLILLRFERKHYNFSIKCMSNLPVLDVCPHWSNRKHCFALSTYVCFYTNSLRIILKWSIYLSNIFRDAIYELLISHNHHITLPEPRFWPHPGIVVIVCELFDVKTSFFIIPIRKLASEDSESKIQVCSYGSTYSLSHFFICLFQNIYAV